MPLQVQGEGYRDFGEPRFFTCEVTAQVQQIYMPVDKSHALVALANGTVVFELWKFDESSTAAGGLNVLVPLNPFFASAGRWIRIPFGGGSSGAFNYGGHGSPEGVQVALPFSTYWDDDNFAFYVKRLGTGNTSTGWHELIG